MLYRPRSAVIWAVPWRDLFGQLSFAHFSTRVLLTVTSLHPSTRILYRFNGFSQRSIRYPAQRRRHLCPADGHVVHGKPTADFRRETPTSRAIVAVTAALSPLFPTPAVARNKNRSAIVPNAFWSLGMGSVLAISVVVAVDGVPFL
jgi:hypothetical protein